MGRWREAGERERRGMCRLSLGVEVSVVTWRYFDSDWALFSLTYSMGF